jgi:hypothetical protein
MDSGELVMSEPKIDEFGTKIWYLKFGILMETSIVKMAQQENLQTAPKNGGLMESSIVKMVQQ